MYEYLALDPEALAREVADRHRRLIASARRRTTRTRWTGRSLR